jgi:hypothetical protein
VYGTESQADYVGYMSAGIKSTRTNWVKGLNFGGTIDWAIDLMDFVPDDDDDGDDGDLCSPDDKTFNSTSPSRPGDYMIWSLMDEPKKRGYTYITIVNLTPHPFNLKRISYYQMNVFDWDTIPPGKSRQNLAVYGQTDTPVDTNGEAYYEIGDTGKKFVVRATTHIPDDHPTRIVFDLSGMGKGQREYKVPENTVPVTLVITGSNDYGFITSLSHGPGNWMNGIKEVIKDRPLRHVVMPGTHDSGMSKITRAISSFGSDVNTRTQSLSTYNQLHAGARWFDLRVQSVHDVMAGDYVFWTTHINDETATTAVGGSGEKFDEVVDNINRFTSGNPGEVIILQFRYLIGIRSAPSGGPIYWGTDHKNDFFSKLRKINNRCGNIPKLGPYSFAERTVGSLMSTNGNKGCVLIFLDTAHLERNIPEADRVARLDGIYHKDDLPLTDAWPNKEYHKHVAEFNIDKWDDTRSKVLVSQWLSTPPGEVSTLVHSLEKYAVLANNPTLYWRGVPAMSPTAFPNVIMVDYIGEIVLGERDWDELGAELYTLAIGLNLYMLSENCEISPKRSQLLPKRSSNKARIASRQQDNPLVSSWNGIIFANGTIIDNPPPTLRVGQLETRQNACP